MLDARPRKITDYRRYLRLHVYPIFGDLPIEAVTVAEVQSYVDAMRVRGRAPKTILNVHGTVVVPVFDFAHERGWRGPHRFRIRSRRRGARRDGSGGAIHTPARRGRAVTRDTVLLPEEAPDFLAAAYRLDTLPADLGRGIAQAAAADAMVDVDTGDVVAFLYLTGMRWGEMVPLRARDFDLAGDPPTATVRRVVRRNDDEDVIEDDEGKSRNAFRDVLLSDDAVAIVTRRIAGKTPDDLVFTRAQGGQLRYGNWHTRKWTNVLERAAVRGVTKPLTPHKLRHGYATAMIDGGVGLDYICAQLGHSSITVTQTLYIHLTKRRAEASRSVIDLALRRQNPDHQQRTAGERRLAVVQGGSAS